MERNIKLGKNGPVFSRVVAGVWKWGLWGWKLSTQDTLRLIEQSIEYGVSTFDHADIYGDYTNEADFGKALALNPSLREKMQLISKCGIKMLSERRPSHRIKSYDTSKQHILESVNNSLKNLHTEYLDLLLIHRPSPLMDPAIIAEAFETLHRAGKVLHFGVSNFTPSQFEMLNRLVPLCTNQVQASILHLDPFYDGTFDQAIRYKVPPMVWSPLGSGKVFTASENPRMQAIRKVAHTLGEKYQGASLDQILLAWLMRHPAKILPVLGTARPKRIQAAINACDIELAQEEWFELLEAATGHEVP